MGQDEGVVKRKRNEVKGNSGNEFSIFLPNTYDNNTEILYYTTSAYIQLLCKFFHDAVEKVNGWPIAAKDDQLEI